MGFISPPISINANSNTIVKRDSQGSISANAINGSSINTISANFSSSLTANNAVLNGVTIYNEFVSTAQSIFTKGWGAANPNDDGDISKRTPAGFWQYNNASVAKGWPKDWNNWAHGIFTTHNNNGNYYSLQIVSQFFDNTELYWRSTNENGNRPWNEIWHSGKASMSLSSAGYQKLPSGLIIQWLSLNTSNGTDQTIYWPIAFPNAVLNVTSGITRNDLSNTNVAFSTQIDSPTLSNTTIRVRKIDSSGVNIADNNTIVNVFVIGY